MQRLFDAIHHAFHDPERRSHRVLHAVVNAVIVFAVVLFSIDLYLGLHGTSPRALFILDRVVLGLFAVELVLRVGSYRPPALAFYDQHRGSLLWTHLFGRFKFCFQPLILVDILAVLALHPLLRGLRALRMLRLVRTAGVFRYSNPLGSLARAFADNRLLYSFAISLLGVEVLVGGLTIYLVETGKNDKIAYLSDGFWWAIVTLTTVGFGDITPQTLEGRLVGAALMVGGMFTLALFAGIAGHTLLSGVLSIREDQFRMSDYIDHIVVCGYEEGSRTLLDALLAEEFAEHTALVLFGPGERPPGVQLPFFWISGDPAKERELNKARVGYARAVVLVGSRVLVPQQADASTILMAFTIRRYLRKLAVTRRRVKPLYIVAEILEPENVEHARASGVDEVIESSRLGFSLVAHAVSEPGTGRIMGRMAAAGEQTVYIGKMPAEVETPITFEELSHAVHARAGVLLMGLRDTRSGTDQINPPDDLQVTAQHELIYLAEHPMRP
ncbi:MAG: ion transporter [Deltaproteobacteria bacterium]|nr:ion transporter [Deltaproteobacteria bacterium]